MSGDAVRAAVEPASSAGDTVVGRSLRIGMVGNVVTQPFAPLKNKMTPIAAAEIDHLDFGQVVQTLRQPVGHDYLVVHLDHRWFFDVAPDRQSMDTVAELIGHARDWLARGAGTLILNTVPFLPVSSVESDLHDQLEALAAINTALFALAREHERVSVVDVGGALSRIGYASALRERNRHIMQAPYSPAASAAIVALYERSIHSYLKPRRKALMIDADNTLWGGVVGEVGAEGVAVDREYPGIVHFLLQAQLKRLRDLGILLCVVTKNNEQDFLEVFQQRDMPLALADITAYRSNWSPKSENIRAIADQLNIGLDALVFLDDNPFEIEEVRTALPGVDCRLFPHDRPEEALALLVSVESLHTRSLTVEDVAKAEQYRAEAQRADARETAGTLGDYLTSLNIVAHVHCNDPAHVRRVAQLTNKTNQFNLTCRRYTEAEIEQAMADGSVYDFRIVDRFGDMGIVAVAIVRDGELENLLMSCRALGRQIEAALLRYVCDRHPGLLAHYLTGPRNGMVGNFLDRNGFGSTADRGSRRDYRLLEGPANVEHLTIVEHPYG